MFYQHLPLYLKLTLLLKLLYQVVHHLPREYKYSLGQEIINQNWRLLDLFVTAQSYGNLRSDRERKIDAVNQMSLTHNCFRLRIRFLAELQLVSLGQVAQLDEYLDEIGRMIGGWKKQA